MIVNYVVGVVCLIISAVFVRDSWRKGCKGWAGLFTANIVWIGGTLIWEMMK
jgi:hypothetical protein